MPETTTNYRHFLIVDDDPIIASLLEQMLMQRGAKRVYIATDGASALGILTDTSKPVDVLTLDLNMPNMDGVTFLSRAAELDFQGGIFLISGESPEIVQSARQLAHLLGLNCKGSFSKPIDFEIVVDKLLSEIDKIEVEEPRAIINFEQVNSGLRENRLVPFYQPKISTKDCTVQGAEALARIIREDGSILHVPEMIRIAEETGLIRELTWQMAKQVVSDYDIIKQHIDNDFSISFNISTDLLTDTVFCDELTEYVLSRGADPSNFVLELTESKIPGDTSIALEGLTRLRIRGFGLAIDDFGTGFSNMESLRLYPFTELKVDQQFIMNARQDTFAWACVEASVKLGKQLGLHIVAEGIESEFEATLAKAHAIDEMQGFLFSKPLPREHFLEFVEEHYRRHGVVQQSRQLMTG